MWRMNCNRSELVGTGFACFAVFAGDASCLTLLSGCFFGVRGAEGNWSFMPSSSKASTSTHGSGSGMDPLCLGRSLVVVGAQASPDLNDKVGEIERTLLHSL